MLTEADDGPPLRVLLVASGGGHLAHLLWLRAWWSRHARLWVSFDQPDVREALVGEDVCWAWHPTNRDPVRFALNFALALRVIRRFRPDVVVSSGAGVAVPLLGAARLLGVPTVFLEVYDRVSDLSLTGRLVAPWVDRLVLQHPEQQRGPGARGVVWGPIR